MSRLHETRKTSVAKVIDVWPGLSPRLEASTQERLQEILDWADRNEAGWLFDVLSSRIDQQTKVEPKLPNSRSLRDRFSLTETQAHVLNAFVGGQSLQEIAEDRSVSITTVRTHFVQIREKLGARDQADVVRIALGVKG